MVLLFLLQREIISATISGIIVTQSHVLLSGYYEVIIY